MITYKKSCEELVAGSLPEIRGDEPCVIGAVTVYTLDKTNGGVKFLFVIKIVGSFVRVNWAPGLLFQPLKAPAMTTVSPLCGLKFPSKICSDMSTWNFTLMVMPGPMSL